MKIKKTEQILHLFDDRSAHSGLNKKLRLFIPYWTR